MTGNLRSVRYTTEVRVDADVGDVVLELAAIGFVRGRRQILDDVSLTVERSQRWVLLGANGSGKTTLVRIAAMYEHPSSGEVRVLGQTLGRTDVRQLRRRIGYTSAALSAQFRPQIEARDVVMTARYAALEPWWHQYTDDDRARADACLDDMGVGEYGERAFGTLSSGEQQRVLLARTLMNDPEVVLLDEPAAGLDLGGREELVDSLAGLANDSQAPPFLLVTHHVDEIPPGITHAMLLRDGHCVAAGPHETALTSETISECFGLPLSLERRRDGRLSAWARR